jgi:hypothetical protein
MVMMIGIVGVDVINRMTTTDKPGAQPVVTRMDNDRYRGRRGRVYDDDDRYGGLQTRDPYHDD